MFPNKINRTGAIILMCQRCFPVTVRACDKSNCALYEHRCGNSGASPSILDYVIKTKCLQCKGEDVEQAKACTDTTCPLFGYSWADILYPNRKSPPMTL